MFDVPVLNQQASAQPVLYRPGKVVVFSSGEGTASELLVEPALSRLRDAGVLESIDFQNVSLVKQNDAAFATASVFVFLLDSAHASENGASQAAHLAMRRAMSGDALIIPLILDEHSGFEQSALAFLTPVLLTGQKVRAGLSELEQRITGYIASKHSLPRPLTSQTTAGVQNNGYEQLPAGSQLAAQQLIERVAGASQIAESVDPLPCHISAYDNFVEELIARLQVMRMNDRRRNLNLFSEALRQVLGAEMVYCYFRGKNGDLHLYEAESNKPLHDCPAAVVHSVLEEALAGHSNQLTRRSLHLQNFLPQLAPQSGSSVECMVIVNERLPNCGVFVAARGEFSRFPLTEILSTVINTLHDALAWASFETFEKLKARVYDALKTRYRFVSDDMYDDRRRIFKNQLKGIGVHFEPMFRFDRNARNVEIFAYEALARENVEASAAPVDVFNTSSLWGMGFQCELDSTLLETTIASYGAQVTACMNNDYQIKPLSMNVYPATLRSPAYRELLYETLGRSAPLYGHHLIMEVSEKTVVSPELQIEARKQLEEYRSIVKQLGELTGVRFAIDDFGVGNSSLSRLDSLKPHYVKIDRDILSFDTRMANTLIRYLIESQNEQGTSVILEGVDIHSKLSLHDLVNDIGVGLIQGHSLSKAVSGFDRNWETDVCERVKNDLGWTVPAVLAAPDAQASMLH